MSRLPDLNAVFGHPMLIGFGRLEDALSETVNKGGAEGFPPYNLEQLSADHLVMTFAVAGFTPDDLDVVQEGRQLRLAGKITDTAERTFLHRGIAARGFRRRFLLADGYDVVTCTLKDGLLIVEIVRPKEESAARKIPITPAS